MNSIFFAKVKNNKVIFNDVQQFNDSLISLEGKDVEVIVRTWKKERSNDQNRYYWGVIIKLLSNHFGYTPEEMHNALKMLFLKDESRKIPTLRNTSDLTTVEFENYLAEIKQWAAAFQTIYIPDPNEIDV